MEPASQRNLFSRTQNKTILGMRETRRVSFAEKVETHEVPALDLEEIAELFYCKHDFRGFKNDQLLQQDKNISRAIRRLIENTVDDMDYRMAHTEKVQEIENILLSHAEKLDRDLKIGESSRQIEHDEEEDLYEETLRQESERLDQEREKLMASQNKTNASAGMYTKTREFIEMAKMLEDSCSSLLNFQPVDFEPELSALLGSSLSAM
ncbi:hypothetical protein ACA910_011323 [Epithemia clementina (nom. ined.)]